jgi:tRNA G37 N-methylase Trm5
MLLVYLKCFVLYSGTVGIPIKVFAIEKNDNAVITLRNRVRTDGWKNVTVVNTDMRQWVPGERAHVIVSELLGSWGDNECELLLFFVSYILCIICTL